jgi:hypothetical protein
MTWYRIAWQILVVHNGGETEGTEKREAVEEEAGSGKGEGLSGPHNAVRC